MKEFFDIAEETSSKAAAVKCDIDDYIEGVKVIIERLQEDVAAGEESR